MQLLLSFSITLCRNDKPSTRISRSSILLKATMESKDPHRFKMKPKFKTTVMRKKHLFHEKK